MGRISDHRGFVGTRGIFLKRRRYSQPVQTTSPVMNSSTPETASVLSLTGNLEELDWYFQDMFDQFGNMYCLFNDINRLLVDCPLEFLLFETQQLSTSSLKMPAIRTYEQRSFAPFPITYSSKYFAPFVWENQQISHVRYLL